MFTEQYASKIFFDNITYVNIWKLSPPTQLNAKMVTQGTRDEYKSCSCHVQQQQQAIL